MTVALGLLAAALTTGCWLPQLLRSWRTRSTMDVSWVYLAVLSAGLSLWLTYGVLMGDPVIVLANALALTAIAVLASMKVRFDAEHAAAGR
jgi:MtN3 and saliva related transmembrane protein